MRAVVPGSACRLALTLDFEHEEQPNGVLADFYALALSTYCAYPLKLMKMPPSGDRQYSRPSIHLPSSILRRMAFSDSPVSEAARRMVT